MRMYLCMLFVALSTAASAQEIEPREGWVVRTTGKPYEELVADVKAAAGRNGMGVVTEAGPTGAAAARGIEIPGNRVIGLFNNDFAVRILRLSTAALIEAPIRMYVTEESDGTATLSYKSPSLVFSPYLDDGGDALAAEAAELDGIFAAIVEDAVR